MNFANVIFATKNKTVEDVPVWMSKDKTIPLTVKDDIIITLPKSEVNKVKAIIKYNSPLVAPIKKNTKLGEIEIRTPNDEVKRYPLIAAKDIHKLGYFSRLLRNLDYHLFAK